MPKSKRNKTVDLSKTKKHGLEGKKELYKKIQSNVENYAHVFVFAVNDMRNSKMKNVREQWKHSRFCIGKNKVMALALGRTPEEEFRPNLHKIGEMLVGERGLLFTNQSTDEVTNWFQSYSEADYARSGNIATEDVILPEGPLVQFPHNVESYLRQLGLPTTLKKGVIHLIKEHVVCREGDRLSPETARILKYLGYEMAEFRIRILSVWSQNGSFVNLQSDACNPESKENAASPQKSFMREDFELAKDCLLLGDDDDVMEIGEVSEDESKISNLSKKEIESKQVTEDSTAKIEVVKLQTPNGHKSVIEAAENSIDNKSLDVTSSDLEKKQETETVKLDSKKTGKKSFKEAEEDSSESLEIISCDLEKKPKRNARKNISKVANKTVDDISENNTNSEVVSKKSKKDVENPDPATHLDILELTAKKLEESAEKPKKFSPKMTRARAAAANKKIKTPEPIETKRSSRKRKM